MSSRTCCPVTVPGAGRPSQRGSSASSPGDSSSPSGKTTHPPRFERKTVPASRRARRPPDAVKLDRSAFEGDHPRRPAGHVRPNGPAIACLLRLAGGAADSASLRRLVSLTTDECARGRAETAADHQPWRRMRRMPRRGHEPRPSFDPRFALGHPRPGGVAPPSSTKAERRRSSRCGALRPRPRVGPAPRPRW